MIDIRLNTLFAELGSLLGILLVVCLVGGDFVIKLLITRRKKILLIIDTKQAVLAFQWHRLGSEGEIGG